MCNYKNLSCQFNEEYSPSPNYQKQVIPQLCISHDCVYQPSASNWTLSKGMGLKIRSTNILEKRYISSVQEKPPT
jgi:hypothetical protein